MAAQYEIKPFTMALSYNNADEGWFIPVLPEEIKIERAGASKEYNIVGLGRVNAIEEPELRKISIESFFPSDSSAPYVYRFIPQSATDGNGIADHLKKAEEAVAFKPHRFVKDITSWMSSKHPARFIYVGQDTEDHMSIINLPVSIDGFDYWEKAGSPGDIYFKLDLVEYVFYSPFRIKTVEQADGSKKQVKEPEKRADDRVPQMTYTIKPGDNLIKIARMQLGDDSRWREIQKLNRIADGELRSLRIGRVLQLPPKKR
ncbi:LysM peptidoglycan-binding domain-containing protein [Cohnella panacarvi]|uniref:LysM peptidoglycan-binding domain-containing protein n=1 Tax=Cohnella panacarvi TaxID=400776 RepID=UPI00047BCA84|nr:LysM peptidoglycan-binding domain-containing protein [Cohnella panacarvi]